MKRFNLDGTGMGMFEEPDGRWVEAEEALATISTLEAQLLVANRVADGVLDTNRMFVACRRKLKAANPLLSTWLGRWANASPDLRDATLDYFSEPFENPLSAQLRESFERGITAEVAAKRLEEADGLWRYWCAVDITENEDEWAAFSDAVRDHLDGKPVPKRFLKK